jgi:hypothetical protein
MIKKFNKKVKKMKYWDVGLLKWGMIAFTLFLITVWPGLHDLVMQAHWGWYLGAAVLLFIKPAKVFLFCCK